MSAPWMVPDLPEDDLKADARLTLHGFRRQHLVLTNGGGPVDLRKAAVTRWAITTGTFSVRITRSLFGDCTLELGMSDPDGIMWRPWSINPTGNLTEVTAEALSFVAVVGG